MRQKHPMELNDVTLVYVDDDDVEHEQPVSDVTWSGTLIDPDSGHDLELSHVVINQPPSSESASRAATNNNHDYSGGHDDGYRAGLQKARDAIADGELFNRQQVKELQQAQEQIIVSVIGGLDQALIEVAAGAGLDEFAGQIARIRSQLQDQG